MAKGFMATMKEFFGLKPGQSPMDFGREVQALSFEEKMEFWHMLKGAGIECDQPMPAK